MNVIYMGKNKKSVVEGLHYLLEKKVRVVCVVAQSDGSDTYDLIKEANKLNIPVLSENELYSSINDKSFFLYRELQNVDYILSFLFWNKLKKSLLNLPKKGCINFHPAPLPDFKGWGLYAFGIYLNVPYWGVSAHFMDDEIDTGNIIHVMRFKIEMEKETAYSLEKHSQRYLLTLFKNVIKKALIQDEISSEKQPKIGQYYSKKDFEKLRAYSGKETNEEIDRKIRAFWFPPYKGFEIVLGGNSYTLVNDVVKEQYVRYLNYNDC